MEKLSLDTEAEMQAMKEAEKKASADAVQAQKHLMSALRHQLQCQQKYGA